MRLYRRHLPICTATKLNGLDSFGMHLRPPSTRRTIQHDFFSCRSTHNPRSPGFSMRPSDPECSYGSACGLSAAWPCAPSTKPSWIRMSAWKVITTVAMQDTASHAHPGRESRGYRKSPWSGNARTRGPASQSGYARHQPIGVERSEAPHRRCRARDDRRMSSLLAPRGNAWRRRL